MDLKTVNPDELKPHPDNPRVHPDTAIEKLVKSIEEFGWTNPILVSEDGYVLAGHARLKAAKEAKLKEVPVIELPLSGSKAVEYMIADNKLQDETSWDFPKLKDLLEDIEDVELTGFSEEEAEQIIKDYPDNFEDLLEDVEMDRINQPSWVVMRFDAERIPEVEAALDGLDVPIERSYETL